MRKRGGGRKKSVTARKRKEKEWERERVTYASRALSFLINEHSRRMRGVRWITQLPHSAALLPPYTNNYNRDYPAAAAAAVPGAALRYCYYY